MIKKYYGDKNDIKIQNLCYSHLIILTYISWLLSWEWEVLLKNTTDIICQYLSIDLITFDK